jgi:hypothetical protein
VEGVTVEIDMVMVHAGEKLHVAARSRRIGYRLYFRGPCRQWTRWAGTMGAVHSVIAQAQAEFMGRE